MMFKTFLFYFFFSFACISAFGQSATEKEIVTKAGTGDDIAAALGEAEESQKMAKVVRSLRSIAAVILLIALIYAAVAASHGKPGVAAKVFVAGLILFGGFWIFAMIKDPFSGSDPKPGKISYDARVEVPSEAQIGQILQHTMLDALAMLTSSVFPFIVIFGFWLAVDIALTGSPEGIASIKGRYIVGAIIVFGCGSVGALFNVLPDAVSVKGIKLHRASERKDSRYEITRAPGVPAGSLGAVGGITYNTPGGSFPVADAQGPDVLPPGGQVSGAGALQNVNALRLTWNGQRVNDGSLNVSTYGYEKPGDPDWDYNSSMGIGNRDNRLNDHSVAVSRDLIQAYNLKGGEQVWVNGQYIGNYDDSTGRSFTYNGKTTPITNTIDIYSRNGSSQFANMAPGTFKLEFRNQPGG